MTKKSILFVEDEPALAQIYVSVCADSGIACDTAENGRDALMKLEKKPYSVVVTDIVMPKMDGFAFLQALRKTKKGKEMPVIVLSNLGQQTDKQECARLGVDSYFVKTDVGPDDIVLAIKNIQAKHEI
jgi:DNA-binding response OmpR family regulator